LRIVIDPQSRVPIYAQVMQGIKELINRGQLPVGHRLPSVRQLSDDLHINLNTVARAYRELAALGLLDVRRGRSVIVASAKSVPDEPRRENVQLLAGCLVNEAVLIGLEPDQIHALVDAVLRGLQI